METLANGDSTPLDTFYSSLARVFSIFSLLPDASSGLFGLLCGATPVSVSQIFFEIFNVAIYPMFRSIFAAVLLLLGLFCDISPALTDQTGQPIAVVSSISPLGSLVRSIGAELVELDILISSGVDPHSFELTPKQALLLNQAELVIFNGLELEFWARGIEVDLQGKTIKFSAVAGIVGGDPHIWLNPVNVTKLVAAIAERLCILRPQSCPIFRNNAQKLTAQIDQLDQEIALEIGKFSSKTFLAYHSAWSRFAERYGLIQGGRLRLDHSSEVRASDILKLIKEAQSSGAKALFVDPFTPAIQIEPILQETQLKKVRLDELGTAEESYLDLMRRNLAAIKAAMG